MFQSFDVTARPENGPPRLALLRAELAAAGVDAFLVPRADAHRGENVAACDERLAWVTGFTGSAGFLAVTADAAALFVDGRYTLQVQNQVDSTAFAYRSIPEDKLADWLTDSLEAGQVLGIDPWLHTASAVQKLEAALAKHDVTIRHTANLVDAAWTDRPDAPAAPITPYPLALAGEAHEAKRARIGSYIASIGADAAVLTLPDSIAWLLNIRGSDIERMPVARAFAILETDGATALFITDPDAVGPETLAHLGSAVNVHRTKDFPDVLSKRKGKILVDKDSAPLAVSVYLSEAEIIWKRDPCILPKAEKNPAELDGARTAQMRDAGAMVEFLAWLDTHPDPASLTEIKLAETLETFRRATNALVDLSFETISGAGPNGAIVHYRVTSETDRALGEDTLFLVDSGGQYLDGTTDITRTIAIGTPPEGAMRAFTLVLKGMIGISQLRWPAGLAGRDIDVIARAALWQAGLDYDHGTGHGVGAYLGVHEGPAGISRRSTEPIRTGMILSNEPGYYRTGAFGIRIENLVIVAPPEIPDGGERAMHQFETLTWVPIDRRLIDADLLTKAERDWLNAYHAEVRTRLSGKVSDSAGIWLEQATQPI